MVFLPLLPPIVVSASLDEHLNTSPAGDIQQSVLLRCDTLPLARADIEKAPRNVRLRASSERTVDVARMSPFDPKPTCRVTLLSVTPGFTPLRPSHAINGDTSLVILFHSDGPTPAISGTTHSPVRGIRAARVA